MKKVYILMVLLFFNSSYPYVHRIESWHYCQGQLNMPPKLYLFSDNHTKKEPVYPQQRRDMWDFICKTNSSFIAEIDKKKNTKLSLPELYKQLSHTSNPFKNLWMQSACQDIITSNVDFRLNHLSQTLEEFEKKTNEQIKTILAYKDHPLLMDYYKWNIEDYQETIAPAYRFVRKNLDQIRSDEVQENARKIIHFFSPPFKEKILDPDEMILLLSTFSNSKIFELELLHAISEHGKKGVPSAVIYAGGKHFDNIKPLLTELGYRQYRSIRLLEEKGELLQLAKYLKVIEPTYDPDAPRPQNMVDYLLRYKKFEHEHPSLAIAIPSLILLSTAAVLGALSRLVTAVLSND